MIDEYMLSLAREYVQLVDMMRSGEHSGHDERHELDSQRQTTHNELLRLTGMTREDDMYRYCQRLIRDGVDHGTD